MIRFFYWLCELVTGRECRRRRDLVVNVVAQAKAAHAHRLQAHYKLDQTLREI